MIQGRERPFKYFSIFAGSNLRSTFPITNA